MIPRIQNNFDIILQQGGVMDLHTLEELDQRRREQVDTRSEATVSKLDLKAPGRARREYSQALRFLARNEFQNAVESLKKALSIYPNFVAAHNALGCAYFDLGQNDQARQQFAQAIQLDDHLSSSYLNLGRAELALGHIPAAQASMEKASAIAPLDPNLLLALTYTQFLNRDYSAAIKTSQRAHSRSHEGTAIVHYFAAASWQAQNHLQETRDELQTFLAEDPKSPFAAQARKIVGEIKLAGEQPPAPSLAMSTPSFLSTSTEPSSLGQKVLQDFREKQQIAEAEKEGSSCSSCSAPDPSLRAESEVSPGSEPRTDGPDPSYGAWTLRSTVNEVAVLFSVTEHGKSVSDISQAEVTLLDDKKPPAVILGFRSESELPLRLGLIIDTSASITSRFSFEQGAAANFLQQVVTSKRDLAFVAGFSNSIVLAQDFTVDLKQLSHGINQLVPVGGTAIWDAVSFAADKLAERTEGLPVARILVVISDGDDNSSHATLKQAIERAERDEVVVYTVSTRYADLENYNDDSTGNRAMKVLADLTGGAAFFPGAASALNRSLAELQQVIRSRYLISYRPAEFRYDGRYRAIAISAEKSGHKLKVNARRGYYSDTNSADKRSH